MADLATPSTSVATQLEAIKNKFGTLLGNLETMFDEAVNRGDEETANAIATINEMVSILQQTNEVEGAMIKGLYTTLEQVATAEERAYNLGKQHGYKEALNNKGVVLHLPERGTERRAERGSGRQLGQR